MSATETFDVVVLGSGAAGAAAAISAYDAGASVVILEKCAPDQAGGNTRVSGSSIFHSLDAERGADYLRALADRFPLPEDVVRTWADETVANAEWLTSIGANLQKVPGYGEQPEYPELDGSDAYGGYLAIDGVLGHQVLWQFLMQALADRGIEIHYETPGRRLRTDGQGTVTGVIAEHDGTEVEFGARRGVVLATGGFQANAELVQQYLPLSEPKLWGTPHATGDGLKMAMAVGADLWHMDNMMSISGVPDPETQQAWYQAFVFRPGFIWVAPDGRRFINERAKSGHGVALLNDVYEVFPTRRMHVVFDEATRAAGPISLGKDLMAVGWNVLINDRHWSADNLAEVEAGILVKGDTIAELADQLGVEAEVLTETITRYNAACAAGEDPYFGRDPDSLVPLETGPYYAYTAEPMLAWTNGGPRRNGKARVLNVWGEPIGGLYAAGEISSTYSLGKDGGFHMADALAFGRVAGREAAARELS
ncbi:FAD-dependent oxidoreductase [Enemella sp. A6]|uniref:FAD-dependent oxidoreductase n=1 Tax=Enemella sp. A6 TaxID=3440152 RepID=UPI003EC0ACEE